MMNSQSFSPEEVKKGLLKDLLNYLLDYNKKSEHGYYDIHITSDSYCTIVEWAHVLYQFKDEEGKFVYVDSDGVVLKEVRLPDGNYDLFYPEEVEEKLIQWHKDNPGWVKTSHGTWINAEENRRSNIEIQCKEWMKRKVDENDSTFKESTLKLDPSSSLKKTIKSVEDGVLRRTGYVVMSKKVFSTLFNSLIDLTDNIAKVDDIKIETQLFYEKEAIETTIPIYVTDYLTDNSFYYITDDHYLIYRLNLS